MQLFFKTTGLRIGHTTYWASGTISDTGAGVGVLYQATAGVKVNRIFYAKVGVGISWIF